MVEGHVRIPQCDGVVARCVVAIYGLEDHGCGGDGRQGAEGDEGSLHGESFERAAGNAFEDCLEDFLAILKECADFGGEDLLRRHGEKRKFSNSLAVPDARMNRM
jgi:hypothetical protein